MLEKRILYIYMCVCVCGGVCAVYVHEMPDMVCTACHSPLLCSNIFSFWTSDNPV